MILHDDRFTVSNRTDDFTTNLFAANSGEFTDRDWSTASLELSHHYRERKKGAGLPSRIDKHIEVEHEVEVWLGS
jgi:hypothetical protein